MKKDAQMYLAHIRHSKMVWGVVETRLEELDQVVQKEFTLLL